MSDRFERVTVYLTHKGQPTGEQCFVILDHAKRLARRFETREAIARAEVLPVEIMEAQWPGNPSLYTALAKPPAPPPAGGAPQ